MSTDGFIPHANIVEPLYLWICRNGSKTLRKKSSVWNECRDGLKVNVRMCGRLYANLLCIGYMLMCYAWDLILKPPPKSPPLRGPPSSGRILFLLALYLGEESRRQAPLHSWRQGFCLKRASESEMGTARDKWQHRVWAVSFPGKLIRALSILEQLPDSSIE